MTAPSSDMEDEKSKPDPRAFPRLYYATISSIPDPMSQLLESYSGIPPSQQIDHVLQVRESAYDQHPYPCLGRFRFLQLDLSTFPLYESYVLPILKDTKKTAPSILLDLGTCLGQDLRKLVVDGVSPSQLYGADIEPAFIKSGFELFKDESKFPADHFICPADIFDTSADNKLHGLDNQVDILHVSAVFHLFDLESQIKVAQRCLDLLRKDTGKKVLMLGGQVGNVNAGHASRMNGGQRYRHDEGSWRKMWENVCDSEQWRERVKSVEAQATLEERYGENSTDKDETPKVIGNAEEGFRWMIWSVWVEFK